jgi:hypothetical protein
MRPPKYPLEPLADLRDKKVGEASLELAKAVCTRDAAQRKKLTSERNRDAHGEAAARVRSAEAEALARGELRVADLAQADAWEGRVAAERQALASDLVRASAEEAGARVAQERAFDEVASRKAEAQLVAKDRARWQEVLRKRVDAKEEEASAEAWRPSKS